MSRLDISLSLGWIYLYSILQVGYISTLYSRLDISLLYPLVGFITLSRLDISISLGWIYPIPRLDIYLLYTLGWIYLYSILQVGYISTLYSRLDIYISLGWIYIYSISRLEISLSQMFYIYALSLDWIYLDCIRIPNTTWRSELSTLSRKPLQQHTRYKIQDRI